MRGVVHNPGDRREWGVFAGSYPLTVDDKGRLAIPARFRQALADTAAPLFLTRSYQPCIEIYPATEFRRVADQIENLADRAAADRLSQVFIGNAVESEMDKQGRILLPQLLRRQARLDGGAVLMGQIRRFDLWSEDLWQQRFGGDGPEADLAAHFALLKR